MRTSGSIPMNEAVGWDAAGTRGDKRMKKGRKTTGAEDFVVFPALGYWEIDGKPVSSREAKCGLHPRAVWKPTEVACQMGRGRN